MAAILNLMADWEGSGRYRAQVPGVALAALGHEVMCAFAPGAKDRNGDTFGARCDVLVAHRPDGAEMTDFWHRLSKLPRTGMMVIDLDDNSWAVHPANSAHGLSFPHRLAANMRCADMVTVCSHGLAEIVAHNARPKDIRVVPNFLPEQMLDLPRVLDQEFTLVYTASSSHVIDIPVLQRVLPRVGARVRLLGQEFGLGVPIVHVPWSDNMLAYYGNINGDVGLAPLCDDLFNHGKSDLKIVEYMARGIPFVCSNIGPYAEVAQGLHEWAGFFVSTDDEWIEALALLRDDPERRRAMGENGQEWVRSNRVGMLGAELREKLFRIEGKRAESGWYGEDRTVG